MATGRRYHSLPTMRPQNQSPKATKSSTAVDLYRLGLVDAAMIVRVCLQDGGKIGRENVDVSPQILPSSR